MTLALRISLMALLITGLEAVAFGEEKTGMDAFRLMQEGKAKEAIQIFENLSAKGDTKAMVQLGLYYYEGTGVKQNYPKAMDWWLKAFTNQNADAFVNLGVMHRDGQGVPKNKKIAYCVFLTTHMCGLGSESTQYRSNSSLRRIMEELSKEDIKDCLSNYTLGYITAYIEARGQMKGIPDEYKPSDENPALKDTGWWLDSELDAIYGPPTEAEKKRREDRDRQRQLETASLRHTLVFQIKFPEKSAKQFRSYDFITDQGMGSGPIPEKKLEGQGDYLVYEDDALIYANQHRYVTIENDKDETIVFKIDHPVKPAPSDWSKWQKADYILTDGMEKFTLLHGGEPKSRKVDVPVNMPTLRFKIIKK
ncbi:MAG TPA: tetratricopeptide repeat protein [bacterium]|nr:sel1 repeat family protein [Chlamydiota bacterium]HOE26577.1 tetratricopeptide repeat protein [bacterium]HQM52010.1 tetratricopeptide repeat protein [bacterium]